MKKSIVLFIIAIMACGVSLADDGMGVKVISKNSASSTVSLDDLQLNVEVPVDGYGVIVATSFDVKDWLSYYGEGTKNPGHNKYTTGQEADFVLLRVNITNRMTRNKDFLEDVKVKVTFEDYYEFEGWFYQYNYDNYTSTSSYDYNDKSESGKQNTEYVISRKDQFEIKPMYVGHYVFGCTLPNAIINSKSPLRMEINIDGNEIIYNIRK